MGEKDCNDEVRPGHGEIVRARITGYSPVEHYRIRDPCFQAPWKDSNAA